MYQRFDFGHGNAFVHLVHGLSRKAELDDRAMILDEARIRRAPARREFRRFSLHALNRAANKIRIGSRLGSKSNAADLARKCDFPAPFRGDLLTDLFDSRHQLIGSMQIVEADIEGRARLRWYDIGRRISDIEGRERNRRGLERVRPLI